MKRFAADENFRGAILEGLLKEIPDLDIIRIQDTELYSEPDDVLLEFLAQQDRVLLTRDRNTMPDFVNERLRQGLPMPGVVIVDHDLPIGEAVELLSTLIIASNDDEWENLIHYVPF